MPGVYSVAIPTEPTSKLFNQLLPCIDEDRRERIGRFWRPEDAWRSLLGEALTRAAVVSATGASNDSLSLRRDHRGKPSVRGGDDSFLSISHSGELVVCVFDTCPVGIDVEEIVPVGEESASVVLSPGERSIILPEVREERLASFFELWTMKESYSKVSGSGHQIAFDSFSIANEHGAYAIVHANATPEEAFFQFVPIRPDYLAAVCSLSHPLNLELHTMSVEEIADTLLAKTQHV